MNSKRRPESDSQDSVLRPPKASRARNTSPSGSTAPHPQRLPPETPAKQGSESASQSQSASGLRDDANRSDSHSRTNTRPFRHMSETASQDEVNRLIRSELNGAVWHDPGFFGKYTYPPEHEEVNCVLSTCQGMDPERTRWTYPTPQGIEDNFYGPIIKILDAVGRAVHSLNPLGSEYIPFVNRSTRPLQADYEEMKTSPDILRYERLATPDKAHWHDLDMFIEVKPDIRKASEAIHQCARYTRSMFANRLDRRFINTIAICGTTAIFLHFDRSGLIYSDDVDIYEQAPVFVRALAGLLLRRGIDAGRNPIFTTFWGEKANPTSQLAYEVTIQERTYDVKTILYHRLAIRSRATMTLHLWSKDESNQQRDVVLKLIWRDQTRFREGLILDQFTGAYGTCPVEHEGEVLVRGKPDVVFSRAGLQPGPRGDVFGPSEHCVDIGGAQKDHSRVQTYVVMPPGRPLWQARDAFELGAAMIGALMGHWAFVTSQVQHRDISVNNILLSASGYKYTRPEWARLLKMGARQCAQEFKVPDWGKIFTGPGIPGYATIEVLPWNFDPRRRFECLTKAIQLLGRPEPFGWLCDADMANILTLVRDKASDMHTHRTGTLSFMAVELLMTTPKKFVPHTYLHDLESFFWVLLHVVAEHREGEIPLTEQALEVISRLARRDRQLLGDGKLSILMRIAEGTLDVRSFETSWSEALAPVIENFAKWLCDARKPNFDLKSDPDAHFESVLSFFLEVIPGLNAPKPRHSPQANHECLVSS
ncbi:hypothetical protein FRC11_011718 [Ceratobasidium sp. 423]|nr:hypothetical protein FRC11_011718 [Ceratobasidium sp. 423]